MPLIIWSHPNGSSEVLSPTEALKLAQPAIEHGYAFMSLQFRHPTASQAWYAAPPAPLPQTGNGNSPPPGTILPATDIAAAVQFARLHAGTLGIDPLNIFLVGQSRGSLSVLTALAADQKKTVLNAGDELYLAQSSAPRAVFAAQAQTTYVSSEIETTFLKNYASTQVTNQILAKNVQFPDCREFTTSGRFDYRCHYDHAVQFVDNTIGTPVSAIQEMGKTEPPIWLRYDRTPPSLANVSLVGTYVNNAGAYQAQIDIDNNSANCYEADKSVGCFDVHHPNFGLKLRKTYLALPAAGRTSYVFVQYAVTSDAAGRALAGSKFYENYYCFFMKYQTADGILHQTISTDGEMKRKASVDAENAIRIINNQPTIGREPCSISETGVWPPLP